MNLVDWLAARTGRERVLMALLVGILAPLALVLGVLMPLDQKRSEAERALEQAHMLNIWVAARAEEAARLAPVPSETTQHFDPIGISALEQGLKMAQLWPYVARLEERSQGGIRLEFDAVEFVDLMTWMAAVDPDWGYVIDTFRIEPGEEPAMAKASFLLKDADSG